MANRFPIILDTNDKNRLKELPNGDSLDLANGGIRNATFVETTSLILNGTSLTPFSGSYADLSGKPTIPSDINELTDSQNLLTGTDFASLTNKPTTLSGYGITDGFDGKYSSLTLIPDFKPVATVGTFASLTEKPTTTSGYGITNALTTTSVLKDLSDVHTAAPTDGQLLSWDNLNNYWKPITASGTGTVTQVNAGNGLTGGAITASGTIGVDTGTSANKILQLDSNAKIPAVDGSQLTNVVISGLDKVGNVLITTPTNGQVLKYDGEKWVNSTSQAGGSITFVGDDSTGTAVDASETFKIAGGSNITTSVSGDTLTITGALTPPAGSDREIQFNNGGSFGSDSNFVYTDPIGSGDLRLGVGISTPANLYATGPAAMQNTVLHLHNPTTGNVGAGVKMTRSNTGTTDADGFELFLSNTDEGYLYNNEDENIHIGTNKITRLTISSNGIEVANQGELRLGDQDSSNYVGFKSPTTVGSNVMWTLPATDGSAGNVLSTDGAGTLSWVSNAGGGGGSVGNFTFGSSVIDTDDSSGITITPSVTVSSDMTVQNDLIVANKVTATEFVATSAGTPEIRSATNLDLFATNAVIIQNGTLRLYNATTTVRDTISPAAGDLLYNTTVSRVQIYNGSSWVSQALSTDIPTNTNQLTNGAGFATLASPTFSGTVSGITSTMVGLGNVTNESKSSMFTDPTFTGTVAGVTKAMVGLSNVDNQSKSTMFTDPTFTGTMAGTFGGTVQNTFTITNNGASDYTFAQDNKFFNSAKNDPVLYLRRGEVYKFVVSAGTHPFEIRVSNAGSAYNDGVVNNTQSNGTITFTVPMDAPATLYYQCTSHPGMGNTINIV